MRDTTGTYLRDNLVGATITGVVKTDLGYGAGTAYGLCVRKGKEDKIAWILCDPEGNGPGHLDIQEDT